MSHNYVHLALVALMGISGWMSSGCIAGVHQHEISGSFENSGRTGPVEGRVQSVDLGVVADFRYFRLALPFEGQSRNLEFFLPDGPAIHSLSDQIENRTLRLDLPLLTITEFGDDPSGQWYPGNIPRRHSLDFWLSASAGLSPTQPLTSSASLTYYRAGAFALRLFGGLSWIPFDERMRAFDGGANSFTRVNGYATGAVFGIELTLAAGEHALELIQFLLDYDRISRASTPRR